MARAKPHLALFDDQRAGNIYRTAARMIYEKGFDATSMSEIAEAVQLTKPGLYYYVKGKKELLFSIMSFAMDLLEEQVVKAASAVDDPEERLRVMVSEHARLLTQDTQAVAILIDEVSALNPLQQEEITKRKRAYFDLLRDTLDTLKEHDKLRAVDTTVAAFSLLGILMWISRWYAGDGRLSREAVVDDITEIAVGAMLSQSGPREAGPLEAGLRQSGPRLIPVPDSPSFPPSR